MKQQHRTLESKVALITGGSRGIGAAIARRLASDGARVIITYNASETQANEVVAEIAKLGGEAIAVRANVSSEEDNRALMKEVSKFGRIDILVNNAAVFDRVPVEAINLSQYDKIFDTNVRGVVATTSAALPLINDGGRIINISSFGASRAHIPGVGLYLASKAAMDALTRVWAQDLGKRRITVNAVAPGATVSDMMEQGLNKEAQQIFISKTALGRLGEPQDIADVVAFFASDDSRWVTGKILECDGGLSV